jgi:GTP-binding protein HflX
MRSIKLPNGKDCVLSDTVGFISDLPTMLISAFRATLEEVLSADLILHVRDISHADSEAQNADVAAILAELGVQTNNGRVVEVWNKLDKLDADHRDALRAARDDQAKGEPIAVSAMTGEGFKMLLEAIETRLAAGRALIDLDLDSADGQGLHWLYENTEVMARRLAADGRIHLRLRVAPDKMARVARRFPGFAQA